MGERAGFVGATDDAADPAVIAEGIEQTRAEMTGTLEAIQDRLAPERLTDQAVGAATEVTEQARDAAKEVAAFAIGEAKTAVRELAEQARASVRGATLGRVEQVAANTRDTAQRARADLLTTIKQNPVPAALAGIGLAWLWTHRAGPSGQQEYRPSDAAGGYRDYGTAYGAGDEGWSGPVGQQGRRHERGAERPQPLEAAGQAVEQAQQVAGQVVGQAQQIAGQVTGRAQEAAGQAGYQAKGAFWQMVEANPLAVGALGAVVGGVAALLVPETEQENRLLGEARDRVVERVQQAAGEAVDKVEQVATEVGDEARRAAGEVGTAAARAARDQGLTVGGDGGGGA